MTKDRYFSDRQLAIVEQCLVNTEDLVSHRFQLSREEWGSIHYDLRTLAFLSQEEITDQAMAQVAKYECFSPSGHGSPWPLEFYRVCVQDHKVLDRIRRGKQVLRLETLMLYVLTHELIHVVRFSRSFQEFDIFGPERQLEERRVHQETFECLRDVDVPGLDLVLGAYKALRGTSNEQAGGRIPRVCKKP